MAEAFNNIGGLGNVLFNFGLMELIIDEEWEDAADKSQALIFNKMRENVSLTCHSLDILREMGHPYAKKSPVSIHDPDWLVHTQSGALLKSISKVETTLADGTQIRDVGIDESIAPHARDIIFGTSTMVARDFVSETFDQVEEEVMDVYEVAKANIIRRDP